mmetsp:Transcript_52386/g.63139  ORF Transcript_52386/g.63139 Transcript_52386/m.63139 type:complete len:138 (+) Transcript_52386:225-638(+)
MKNDLQCLQHELVSLRSEISSKVKILAKECDAHEYSRSQCSALRVDTNRVRSELSEKQHKIEQQVCIIETLKSTLKGVERDSSRLISQKNTSDETKGFAIVQLNDRTKELEVLYEMAKLRLQQMEEQCRVFKCSVSV